MTTRSGCRPLFKLPWRLAWLPYSAGEGGEECDALDYHTHQSRASVTLANALPHNPLLLQVTKQFECGCV